MKKAIGYIRISDKDQSNFSLEGQEKYINEYAEKNEISLFSIYKDNGRSAKNFDRPDWKLLEHFLKENYHQVDYLIVVKYDRFSRNAAEGLQKIELLEKKYRMIIISVFEQMFIDYDSPFFFKQRADMLVTAEFEWHVIRDRTRFGIHQALSSGRFINMAPYGYNNARDDRNKPIITINESKALIVKMIFRMYLSGSSIVEIYRAAKALGYTKSGHSNIPHLLGNCIYAGLIYVPAYKKEKEKYVKGVHTAIVDEHDWWQAQQRLGSVKNIKTVLNDDVPLRSVLKCFCNKPLTAGNSKGKKKHYWYYKCNDHPYTNLSATKLHLQFDEMLDHLSLSQLHLQYLQQKVHEEMNQQLSDRKETLACLKKELQETLINIDNLEEKFITNGLGQETYKKWYSKYSMMESSLRHRIGELEKNSMYYWSDFNTNLHRLTDIKYLYKAADLVQKKMFIRLVFNSELSYNEGVYRTPYLLPLFSHNELILKQKRLLVVEQPTQHLPEMRRSTRDGS